MSYDTNMVYLIKANGEKEAFSEEKLRHSIRKAGIPKNLEEKVVAHIHTTLYDNMPTRELYKHIVEFLGTTPEAHHRARYSLKQSLMDLGPTGYPFEDYLSKILEHMGYQTKVRTVLMGKCVSHEIDVIAQKGAEKCMVEAKFHNSLGIKTDVHVALYTQARFEDVTIKEKFSKPFLITNTKLTTDAIAYGECMQMQLLGWSYPEKDSLESIIDQLSLYPVTALFSLSTQQKQQLLEKQIVIASDILKNPLSLDGLGLSPEKKKQVVDEATFLSTTKQTD